MKQSPLFSPNNILTTVGRQAFYRGREYYLQGRVVDSIKLSQLSENELQIFGKVQGRTLQPYRVSVNIIRSKHNIQIISDCECYMTHSCKHVAALCFAYLKLNAKKATSPNPVTAWVEKLVQKEQSREKEYPISKRNPYVLIYLLEKNFQGNIAVSIMRTRRLKKGGYGVANNYGLARILDSYNDSFTTPIDIDIATLLRRNSYIHYSSGYTLSGDLGEIALKKILETNRCHWENKDTSPLRLGNQRPLNFTWTNSKGGKRLSPIIEPPAPLIFNLQHPFYIDFVNSEVGQLTTPLSLEKISLLLDAPVIPDSELENISVKLLTDAPEYNLPIPENIHFKEETLQGVTPVPILQLCRLDNEETAQSEPAAKLSYRYHDINLNTPAHNATSYYHKNKTRYMIHRDIQAENQAIDELNQTQLRPKEINGTSSPSLIYTMPSITSNSDLAYAWYEFTQNQIPTLKSKGWEIQIEDSFNLQFEEAEHWDGEIETSSDNHWFDISLGVEINGQKINLLPILINFLAQSDSPEELREVLENQPFILAPIDNSRWIKMPSERLMGVFDTLIELYDHQALDKDGKLRMARSQSMQLEGLLNDPGLQWRGAQKIIALQKKLKKFTGIENIEPPAGLKAELRPYQQQGLNWIAFLHEYGFDGILADDMGLGKTIQTLAALLSDKQKRHSKKPSLIIAPTSLMGNWRREAKKFTPDLSVLLLHGPERKSYFKTIKKYDIVLTTYPLIHRDFNTFKRHKFNYIVLDEAQAIKNPKSKTTQAIHELKADHRLCLTGTPMENHLGELWSMFHFLMPGFLGQQDRFVRLFRTPIERDGNTLRQEQLRNRIKPFMLRRSKQAVAKELPEKTEIIRSVILDGKQRELYESIRLAMDVKVRDEINKKGLARSHIMILDALLKLRQVCCDPSLVNLKKAKHVKTSAKLELLMDILPEMVEEGRKILIFSQFTKMLGIIERRLKSLRIKYSKLTGQTRKRDEAIQYFQEGDASVFLISLKAGGVGLNLTAADTVIHYDPWWNPAVENQATDRAHRIGQEKTVFVYKLITENTVEDKILDLQRKKQALAEGIYTNKTKQDSQAFSAKELVDLLKPLE